MRPLYICDIDGTIANLEHRLHFIKPGPELDHWEAMEFKPDWEAFHDNVIDDKPIWPVIRTIEALRDRNCDVWFFTGRMARCRRDTTIWLERYLWVGPTIEFRPDGDYRADVEIKQEMLDNMLKIDRKRLVGVFDDRQKVVDMWRANGLTCFQVKDGDY